MAQMSPAHRAGFLEEVLLGLGLKGALGPVEKALLHLASHSSRSPPTPGTCWRREVNE